MQAKAVASGTVFCLLSLILIIPCFGQSGQQPKVVSALERQAPSDAVVLFNGADLSEWTYADGSPAGWLISDGTATVKDGSIVTKREFGDMQIHLEFATPSPAKGEGQDRGNSGVYIHRNYELQILDSYGNETYPDGSCGAIYKLYPPLVNVSRPPGIWQVYDIIFHAPRIDSGGKVSKKATITVILNGVLVQDQVEIMPTGARSGSPETARGPILLQDHHYPVKFRNIWVREL
ncbi:MAG TPA: DUF1080 domain-containing protein [archaeon]|nr:DUF1080 domain-containing protein [archaeon]